MPSFTSNLNLYLPGGGSESIGGSDEAADIDKVNQNFQKLDKYAWVQGGTSTERAAIPLGERRLGLIFTESDTNIMWMWVGTRWVSIVTGASSSDWITNAAGIFTIAPGFELQSFRVRKDGLSMGFYVSFVRKGGTITVPTSGDTPNTRVGTFAEGWRPQIALPVSSGAAGRVATGSLDSDGTLNLSAVGGSTNIANDEALSLGGTILL